MVFNRNGRLVETFMCFQSPLGHSLHPISVVAVDKDDNIYVYYNCSLFKFNKERKLIKVAGHKGTRPGEFRDVSFLKIINDKLYVCDRRNHRIQILNTELEYINSFGCHGNGDGQFHDPNGIAQDEAGNLYVTDTRNNRVQVFDCNEQFLYAFSEKGTASKQIDCPYGISVGADQFVYVCEKGNKCVSVFKTSGEFVTSFGQFSNPATIVIDDDGFVYVGEFRQFDFRSALVYCF